MILKAPSIVSAGGCGIHGVLEMKNPLAQEGTPR
jgi:hypothetical protein